MRRLLMESFREGLLYGLVALAMMAGAGVTLGIPALLIASAWGLVH